MRRARTAVALVIVAGLLAPAAAEGQTGDVQETLRFDGQGVMIANANNNPPGQTWTWETCDLAGMACAPFATGQQITTEGAPPNVIFRATSSLGTVVDTRPWRGIVASQSSPSVIGEVRANELVTPIAGGWTGGWDGDFNRFQLAACRTTAGDGCLTLTDLSYGGCPYESAVIDPAVAGRHLRVANVRYAAETAFAGIAHLTPYGWPPLAESQTISVAFVGQIGPSTRPRQAQCGPPPLETGSISNRGVATVSCLLGCRAVLSARRGKNRARAALPVGANFSASKKKQKKGPGKEPTPPTFPPSYELQLSPKALERLGSGRARFVLRIDGEPVARRSISLRSPKRAPTRIGP